MMTVPQRGTTKIGPLIFSTALIGAPGSRCGPHVPARVGSHSVNLLIRGEAVYALGLKPSIRQKKDPQTLSVVATIGQKLLQALEQLAIRVSKTDEIIEV
jgi:hypothetical protein